MRVIAGEKRGLVLQTIKQDGFRPTLARVKESLFGILTPYIEDTLVLDLFAGSGALGIEALSRGAKSVVFIDNNSKAVEIIKKNVHKAGYESQSEIILTDFSNAGVSVAKKKFDLIFADPPYGEMYTQKVIDHIAQSGLLAEDGLLTLELEQHDKADYSNNGWQLVREKKYGATLLWLLRREN